jgi:hypothetical protein
MRKALGTIVVALTLGTLAPASAEAPVQSRTGFSVVESMDGVCAFPMTLRVWGRTRTKVFMDGSGTVTRAISTGPITIVFTNEDTGVSKRFAIPGPSFYDANGALVRGTGPWFAFSADGVPVIAAGNWSFDSGAPVGSGRVRDVCTLLG